MDVIFPVMPFADVGRPAMGVSLLASETKTAGYSASILYCNLDLAGEFGLEPYQRIATAYPPNLLLGEWFFADDVFGGDIPDAASYLSEIFVPMAGPDQDLIDSMIKVRSTRSGFLDRCATRIMNRAPRVVGFTTTFHQTCACLSIARRLKALENPPVIVFGGANCEGEMGLQMITSFPWIDYVCCGESDLSFVSLLRQVLDHGRPEPIAGVLARDGAKQVLRSAPVTNLDALPYPDFDDYFRELADSKLVGQFEAHLVLETSRGCWWGAKHHCTFCGLNGDTMAFRSKTPDRAFAEIDYLTKRHQAKKIGCVDNILDMKYVDGLFPRLAENNYGLSVFYEVKANLRYEQLRQMRAGGLTHIQPGIESFSDQVLALMEKGCSALQNIQLLRWCRELGIEVAWNILAGFPGESPEEYAKTEQLVPKLVHLDPPCSCGLVRLDRFSPFHTRSEQFGFQRIRPARAYYYVFPLARRELNRLAYFFDFDYQDRSSPQDYIAGLQREVQGWLAAHGNGRDQAPRLDAEFSGDRLTITDTRPGTDVQRMEFDGLPASIYAACDNAKKLDALAATHGLSVVEVGAILNDFETRNLMIRIGERYLSLAVFRTRFNTVSDPISKDRNASNLEAIPA